MMMRYLLALSLLLAVGCGEGDAPTTGPTPTAPRPTTPTPIPTPLPTAPTFAGTVTETLTGATVLGFTATMTGSRVTISAPGYVSRETRADASRVDVIRETGFDLAFYRELVRGTLTGSAQSLRVLPQAPSFYMEVDGAKGLSAAVARRLEAKARLIVPALTGGRFQVTRWETGPVPRAPQAGWVVIERRDDPTGACGSAPVGELAGQMRLDGNARCNIESTFAHELGHALGLWHVSIPGSLMSAQDRASNVADTPTDRERHHAAIAYSRERGNRDIDVDP